jgi:hypothetical protein
MLYIIIDILLKVALNANKTGLYVIHYNWHILLKVALNTKKTDHYVIHYNWRSVESGVKHQ